MMKKNYFLIGFCTILITASTYGQQAQFFLDFEGAAPLSALPSGVTNVNGTSTIRIKDDDTKVYAAIPNEVQTDPDAAGEKELFLDFLGYLRLDVADTSTGFSVAYDYRRTDENDDWWLGFLTFIGTEGADNKLERLQIRKWFGELDFGSLNTGETDSVIGFNTNYHIVVTSSSIGDLKIYVNGTEVLSVPNSTSSKNIHTWSNAGLLLSFKGNSFDGTAVTPETEDPLRARDTRAYVDNIALFNEALSATAVTQLFTNGNNDLGVLNIAENSLLNNKIKVYPNPINSSTNKLKISSTVVKSVEIYNILGAKVFSKKVLNSIVNISALTNGTYIVKSFNADGKNISNSKVIKL